MINPLEPYPQDVPTAQDRAEAILSGPHYGAEFVGIGVFEMLCGRRVLRCDLAEAQRDLETAEWCSECSRLLREGKKQTGQTTERYGV